MGISRNGLGFIGSESLVCDGIYVWISGRVDDVLKTHMVLTLLDDVYDRSSREHGYAELTELLVSRVLARNSGGEACGVRR